MTHSLRNSMEREYAVAERIARIVPAAELVPYSAGGPGIHR